MLSDYLFIAFVVVFWIVMFRYFWMGVQTSANGAIDEE